MSGYGTALWVVFASLTVAVVFRVVVRFRRHSHMAPLVERLPDYWTAPAPDEWHREQREMDLPGGLQ